MYMILLVLDDPSHLAAVLENWQKAGISGATIVESSGLHRLNKSQGFIPMRYLIPSPEIGEERGSLTLFSIVPDELAVQAALAAAEEITGSLDNPNTGIFAAWPVSHVKGVALKTNPGGAP